MDPQKFYRDRLAEHVDANGDLVPQWAKFPEYESGTIGWRMGVGESWLSYWHVFLDGLAPDFEVRRAYLKRHPPAPVSWANKVYRVLHPAFQDEDWRVAENVEADRRAELRGLGLIASDVAYHTWLAQQSGVRWPWEHSESPRDAARYWTRNLWFWSRQVQALRTAGGWQPPDVPPAWEACAEPLQTGNVDAVDVRQGLLTMARMLAAGWIAPPWKLHLTPADFRDTFDDDMGFVDAFRLWGMSAFDDREHLNSFLVSTEAPEEWLRWGAEHFYVD